MYSQKLSQKGLRVYQIILVFLVLSQLNPGKTLRHICNLSMCISTSISNIGLFPCLSLSVSVCLCLSLSVSVRLCVSLSLSVCLCLCLSLSLPIYMSNTGLGYKMWILNGASSVEERPYQPKRVGYSCSQK